MDDADCVCMTVCVQGLYVCVRLQAEALTAWAELFSGLYLLNHGERFCLIYLYIHCSLSANYKMLWVPILLSFLKEGKKIKRLK